jgi:prolyl-tRNA editing enzyme YbaK/EbsC (Cys-tRNA(Pro) deacylase)
MSDLANDAPPQLVAFLRQHRIDAEFIAPGVPMPTVSSAAAAIGVPQEQILKTLLFQDVDGRHVVAIANGARRVERQLLEKASGLTRPRAASPDAVAVVTGYPAGGVSPLGLPAGTLVVVDVGVAALPIAYGGGGHEHLLLRVRPADIIRLNAAVVARIVADHEES